MQILLTRDKKDIGKEFKLMNEGMRIITSSNII